MSDLPDGPSQPPEAKANPLPLSHQAVPPEVLQTIHELVKEAQPGAEPQKLEQQLLAIFTKLTISYSRRGPLPHPSELAEYEKVIPGSAARILASSERQMAHRIALEREMIAAQNTQSEQGQKFGFIIAIACLLLSFSAIMTGHEISGTLLGGIDLVSLVAVFVLGKRAQRTNLEEKARGVPPSLK